MARPTLLYVRHPRMAQSWPFVDGEMRARLGALGHYRELTLDWDAPIEAATDLAGVTAIARFGGAFSEETLEAAPDLLAIGVNTDNSGEGLPLEELWARGIAVVDTTRAWAQSVAEVALALAISGLRQIPQWHGRMSAGEPLFTFEHAQFCDDERFVNGDLGTKDVGIIGLGQIGGRVARWCHALGATVRAYDPYVAATGAQSSGATLVDMDELVAASDVVFVTVPPTPSARHLLDRRRVGMLRRGALVVVVTRAFAVDMAALRERIVADEIAGAFDVYDVEPLPVGDPLRARRNVVHTPHIAGRTRDANVRTAQVIADDFARILRGEPPLHALTPGAVAARTGAGNWQAPADRT